MTTMHERLRAETARLLKYDINNLSPAQSVRLDRCATLRLELSDIEASKLAGAPFDVTKYIAISEALERMLGGNPEQQHQPIDQFAGAREELLTFLSNRADKLELKAKREAEASKQPPIDMVPAYDPAAKAELALTDGREPPAVELMPEGTEPPKQPRVTYVDAAVIEPSPLRHSSMNMPTARPTLPVQRQVSETTRSYFANAPGGSGRTGFRRFDPPSNF